MVFTRRRASEPPVWLDDNTWLCRRHVPSAKMPAVAGCCLYGCSVERPARPEGRPIRPENSPWGRFDAMDAEELEKQKIRDLRKYATHGVGVERASKIRGGKATLIPLILAKRGF